MLAVSCKKYIPEFCRLLQNVTATTISPNNYCQNYLQHLLTHKNYYLKIYATVLDAMLTESDLPINQLTVLDFGTGNGLLALFAKYCGCKKVYACDTDRDFLAAAEVLSKQLNIRVEKFIAGGLKEVKDSLNQADLSAVISTDVIEHIYDLKDFMNSMCEINPAMISVMTTASNPENKWKVRELRKLQIRDETLGYSGNNIETEGHPSFLNLRKKIISEADKELTAENLNLLAVATRGLIKKDILKAKEEFLKMGVLPIPADEFNTCHPVSGSFTERIVSFTYYENVYKQAGFTLKIKSGFYNNSGNLKRNLINSTLNRLLKFFKYKISPFIILIGFKK